MPKRLFTACLLLLAILPATAQPTPPAKHPMQFTDLMKMRRLGDTTVSPDGKWVLFAVTDVDLDRNTRTSHLWVAPTAGGPSSSDPSIPKNEKPVTASSAGETRGRFSPDGKQILFASTRSGEQQLYLADFDTTTGDLGEPRQLTTLSTGADAALWSPDGQSILFTSAVYPDCPAGPQQDTCNKQRDDDQAKSKVKAQVFTHLLERHWNSFTGEKRSHLFLVPASGGTPRDLTPGDPHDVPPFSLGGPDAYAFSPDSKEIAFEENLDAEPAISTNADIFTLRLDDAAARSIKISTSPGGDFSPAYSPDGKYIAWRSQARNGFESDRFRLVLYDRQAKQIKDLLPAWDLWIDEFTWSPDSNTIYFVSGEHGEAPIYRANLNQPHPQLLSRLGEFSDLHVISQNGVGQQLIASRMTVQRPSEIVSLNLNDDPKGLRLQPITHLNNRILAQLDLPEMERFWFRGALNTRVQGFLIRPPNFDPSKKYPVKFLIHGGPEGAWGDAWSYRWNPELFAADGYVVVMINPRGSTGYGQLFIDQIDGDWGGKPYIDLMRGLDYAEQHYSFIDKTRECALGASYGGYMADWILGHTDRFACIVTHDGMFNTESAYGTTDELWFNEWEFKGTPWTNRLLYRRWSPMLSATRMKTPTLIVHGQLDYRLDVSEGYQLFTTLERMHVPSQMLYFPDEGHWVLKPQNSQLWNQTVSAWCNKWTKTNQ
jgi:dipeptidyl aminopeptidase/acylaminoacyl peptidase